MSAVIQHLAAAWKCVAELEQLGCRVLSVYTYPHEPGPRIHIADPGSLLDHIDAMSIDCSSVKYTQQSVRIEGCEIFWMLPTPASQLAPEQLREVLS